MGKARTSFYTVKGETLTRTHAFCPKCGPGVVLASHPPPHARKTCGKCGFTEVDRTPAPAAAPKPPRAKGAPKGEKPATPT